MGKDLFERACTGLEDFLNMRDGGSFKNGWKEGEWMVTIYRFVPVNI